MDEHHMPKANKKIKKLFDIMDIKGLFESPAFLQHLNRLDSDLREGDCSANSFHQNPLGVLIVMSSGSSGQDHAITCAYHRLSCVWLDRFCVLDVACCH